MKIGVPHSPQNARSATSEDWRTLGLPLVNRNAPPRKKAAKPNTLPNAFLQELQWQYATAYGSSEDSYLIAPHRQPPATGSALSLMWTPPKSDDPEPHNYSVAPD